MNEMLQSIEARLAILEEETGIVNDIAFFIASGKHHKGTGTYCVNAIREEIEDPLPYFYKMGRAFARNSKEATVNAFLHGIIDAIDAPLKEAMKGGER